MKISIIVPAFNESKLIASSLQAIKSAAVAFTQVGWDCELIVCDNNSSDTTAELARAEGARVVFEPVNQIARARNAGAAVATGDWLVFIDADSWPSPELFADLIAAIQSGRVLGGGATLRVPAGPWWVGWICRFWNGISRSLRRMAGSFVFCEAQVFRQLNGFGLEWYVAEEIDFGVRLHRLARASGKRVVILHRHPLLTSTRKMHLYSVRDYAVLFKRALYTGRAACKDPQYCQPWYDGRR